MDELIPTVLMLFVVLFLTAALMGLTAQVIQEQAVFLEAHQNIESARMLPPDTSPAEVHVVTGGTNVGFLRLYPHTITLYVVRYGIAGGAP